LYIAYTGAYLSHTLSIDVLCDRSPEETDLWKVNFRCSQVMLRLPPYVSVAYVSAMKTRLIMFSLSVLSLHYNALVQFNSLLEVHDANVS